MSGFDNEVVYANNVDFSGSSTVSAQITTNGQLLIGSTVSPNIRAGTLGSSDSSIIWTVGNGTITGQVSGGSTVGKTITGNDSVVLSPSSGNWNIFGGGSITTSGSGNTLTASLTGMTNHAILVGAGTSTLTKLAIGSTGQVLQANTAADPTWSTATFPSTATGTGTILRADGTNWVATTSTYPNTNAVSTLLYASSTNVLSALATANRAVLTTGTTGIPVLTAIATDGQMIIGSTAGAPAAGTITSTGGTITVTIGSNTLNLEVATGGFTWTDVTSSTQAMSVENGYITDRGAGVVYTLPATAVLGSEMIVMGKLGLTTITPNANQQILMSSASGTVGVTGTIVGTNVGDCVTLIATTSGASTVWRAVSWVGNWTVS